MASERTFPSDQALRWRRAWLIACLGSLHALSSAEVYRCTDSRKTVYSDKPCAGDIALRLLTGRFQTN